MKSLDRISQHSFLPRLVDGGLILDLGGNRGEFCGGIAKRYGWESTVVEPTPELATYLRAQGFDVIEAAAGGSDGTATFTFDPAQELTGSILGTDVVSLLDRSAAVVEVPTLSLASLLAGRFADLVKVDIEGAEIDLFLEADDATLLSVRQFTVEFHDYWYPELRGKTERVKQRLAGLGFWTMRGTPNNKDILFVHPEYKPSFSLRMYVGLWLRNVHGLGRALRVLGRRIFPARPGPRRLATASAKG